MTGGGVPTFLFLFSTDERRTLHEILLATQSEFAAFEREYLAHPM